MELSTKVSIWSWQVTYIVPVWLAGNSFKCGHCEGCAKVSPVQARRGWGCHTTFIVIYGLTFLATALKSHAALAKSSSFFQSTLRFQLFQITACILANYILFMSAGCPSALINSYNWRGWVRGSSWVRMLSKVWATLIYSYFWASCFFRLC
jgi:hypothetical protein